MLNALYIVVIALAKLGHLEKFFDADKGGSMSNRPDLHFDHSEPETDPEKLKRLQEFERLSEMESMGKRIMSQFDSRVQAIEEFSKRSEPGDPVEIKQQQQRLSQIRNHLDANLNEQEKLIRLALRVEADDPIAEEIEDQVLELRVAAERTLNGFDKALVMMADRVILSKATIDLEAAQEVLVATVEQARGARIHMG